MLCLILPKIALNLTLLFAYNSCLILHYILPFF